MHKCPYLLIFCNFLFHCLILGLKFFRNVYFLCVSVSIQVSYANQKHGYSNCSDYNKIWYWSFQMTKTQCLLFVPIYSVRWRNQMDSMCLINQKFILNICVRCVNLWVTTVVVCSSNTIGLSSHHCGSLLMETVHVNSL